MFMNKISNYYEKKIYLINEDQLLTGGEIELNELI